MDRFLKVVDCSKITNDDEYDTCIITNTMSLELDITNVTFMNCVFHGLFINKFIDCTFLNNIYSSENEAFSNDPYLNKVCEGDLIVYKKVYDKSEIQACLIVKLLVPAKAKRSSCVGNKCRAEYIKVLEIYNVDGTISKSRIGTSLRDDKFFYIKNRIVKPEHPYDNSFKECTSGIHFFRTFNEAVDY